MPSTAKTGATIRTRKANVPTLSVSRHYPVSPQTAWHVLTDTSLWPVWGPTVRDVRCSERFIRKGSKGRVLTPIGLWVPFLITEYDALRFWGWKVGGIRATGHRLIACDEHSCRIVFEVPCWWFPYVIVCRKAAAKMAELLNSPFADQGRPFIYQDPLADQGRPSFASNPYRGIKQQSALVTALARRHPARPARRPSSTVNTGKGLLPRLAAGSPPAARLAPKVSSKSS